YGLPDDFDLRSDLNLVAACGRCNGQKRANLYPPGQIMIILGLAKAKAEYIAQLRQRYRDENKRDRLMASLSTAIDRGAVSRVGIEELFIVEHSKANLGVAPSSGAVDSSQAEILRIFGNASHALLGWPQETGGQWMPRPEFDELQAILDQNPHSFAWRWQVS